MNKVHPLASIDYPLLRALISPCTVGDFFARHWPEQRFAVHGPVSRLPALLRCPQLSSFKTLADHYAGHVSFGKGTRKSQTIGIENINATQLYDMGLTVCLPDIVPYLPGAAEFLRELEKELGLNEGCARITAFASPREDGLPCHFDAEEVFSIQLQGTKRFEIAPVKELAYPFGMQYSPDAAAFNDLYPQSAAGFPDPDAAEFETVEMEPGSVLYMPRGTWHRTQAHQDSLSVSIILRPPSAAECLLRELHYLLLQYPEWRRPLYGAWDDGKTREAALARARELLNNLPQTLCKLTEQDLAPLSEPAKLQRIERATRFQRAPEAHIEIEPHPGVVSMRVKTLDKDDIERMTMQMDIPPNYVSAMEWLATSKAAFRAGELADRFPGLSFKQHQELLQVLTRARFLKLLWFPSKAT